MGGIVEVVTTAFALLQSAYAVPPRTILGHVYLAPDPPRQAAGREPEERRLVCLSAGIRAGASFDATLSVPFALIAETT
jgi:hypothetical protein